MTNQDQITPIFDMGKNYATNVMSDNYQAFTPEQQQKMIQDQTKQFEDQFKGEESRIASHLANSGLAGSGVAGMDWGGQDTREKKAIADIVSNVGNQNIAATRADKSQAFGSFPALASMSQMPIQSQMTYANLLGQNDTAQNTWNQWNAQMDQAAKMANAGAYQDWFKQASAEASKNQNAFGNAVGSAIGKGGGKG